MKPSRILITALKPYDRYTCGDLARKLGLPGNDLRRARLGANGRPTRAEYHVILCGYLGFDPVSGEQVRSGQRLKFDATLFAIGCRLRRMARRHTIVRVARLARLSQSTISRVENGDPRSFETVIAMARYARIDPRHYIVPVSHETSTGKPLKSNETVRPPARLSA